VAGRPVEAAADDELRREDRVEQVVQGAGQRPRQVGVVRIDLAGKQLLQRLDAQHGGQDQREEEHVRVRVPAHGQARVLEQPAEHAPRVAALVLGDAVVVGVQELVRGHRDQHRPAGHEDAGDLVHDARIVGDVLDRVEEADQVEAGVAVGQGVAAGDHAPGEAARGAVAQALGADVGGEDARAVPSEPGEEAAVPAAEVEHARGPLSGQERLEQAEVDGPTPSEPPVGLLELQELSVGVRVHAPSRAARPRAQETGSATTIISSKRLT